MGRRNRSQLERPLLNTSDDEEAVLSYKSRPPPRRKRRNRRTGSNVDEALLRVSVYCVGDTVDVEALVHRLQRGVVARPDGEWVDVQWENSIHSYNETANVFCFSFGCVVLWGLERNDERGIVSGLMDDPAVRSGATSAAERVEAHDTLLFCSGPSYCCKNDVIRLASDEPLEKLSLSYALAQSAKLFVWEARVDVTINQVKHIPDNLASTGRVDLTETHISQMIGKVFIERTQVNLHSEILDSPGFLWEDDQHEPGYLDLRDHLDVPDRVNLLNTRLDILRELLEILSNQLSNKHSSRLELIVIWLIIAEIIVSILVFALDRLFPKH